MKITVRTLLVAAGAAVGALLLAGSLERVKADKAYTECIAAELDWGKQRKVNNGNLPAALKVPTGWTVMGGGGGAGAPVVVLCR